MAVGLERPAAGGYIQRAPRSSGLADVLELILDRGLVIDAYVRVSLVGIELLTVDLRVVIASVDTYLRFAEAVNRLDLGQGAPSRPLDRGAESRNGNQPAEQEDEEPEDAETETTEEDQPDENEPQSSEHGVSELLRESPALRTTAKAAATSVAVSVAAALAKELFDRAGRDGDRDD